MANVIYISYFKEVLCAIYPVSVVNVTDACVMFAQCTVLSVVCPMSRFWIVNTGCMTSPAICLNSSCVMCCWR